MVGWMVILSFLWQQYFSYSLYTEQKKKGILNLVLNYAFVI